MTSSKSGAASTTQASRPTSTPGVSVRRGPGLSRRRSATQAGDDEQTRHPPQQNQRGQCDDHSGDVEWARP
jgi:hypothetical protein